MSTFGGRLVNPELAFITIDHFEQKSYECDIFLLSHHHCDHMRGILTNDLGKLINESKSKFVYCSPLTAHFLRKNRQCSIRHEKIVELSLCKPIVLLQDHVQTHIVVTSLPAAHCVGSVMFLIQFNGKNILYSGDIRLTLDDLKKIQGLLTNPDGSLIHIDDLYLDTTFVTHTPLNNFPSREESEETVIDFMWKYLRILPGGKFVLDLAARFGYETLFIKISRAFKTPIMVHDQNMIYYDDIEEMRAYVTCNSRCGRNGWLVHACLNYKNCELVNATANVNIFKPCALSFVSYADDINIKMYQNRVPYYVQGNVTKVFYGTHCSLNELRDMYTALKPKRVFPSVRGNLSSQNILKLLGVNEKPACLEEMVPSRPKRERVERPLHEIKKKINLLGDD